MEGDPLERLDKVLDETREEISKTALLETRIKIILFRGAGGARMPCVHIKAVVKYVEGLLASRRAFCWLPFVFFCTWPTNGILHRLWFVFNVFLVSLHGG